MSIPDLQATTAELLGFLRDRYSDAGRTDDNGRDLGSRGSHGDPLVDELVRAMLQWEASHGQARNAYERLLGTFVDYNELRASLPDHVVEALGPRYPKAAERSERMRMALTAIFEREDALTLAHLRDTPKREARAYVESLDGLPRFAAARVVLLGLGGHAFPVDGRLAGLLRSAGVVEEDADTDKCCLRMERAIRAGDAREAYELLELWSGDEGAGFVVSSGGAAAGSKGRKKRPSGRKAKTP